MIFKHRIGKVETIELCCVLLRFLFIGYSCMERYDHTQYRREGKSTKIQMTGLCKINVEPCYCFVIVNHENMYNPESWMHWIDNCCCCKTKYRLAYGTAERKDYSHVTWKTDIVNNHKDRYCYAYMSKWKYNIPITYHSFGTIVL